MNEIEILKESAKLYYRPHGQNSWDHVTQVCSNMEKMTLTLEGRLLELSEMAAGLFHDCSVCFKSGKDRHGYWSAEMSHQTFKRLGFFSDAELHDIYVAIVEHETLDKKGGPFTTALGDLLASGDANPPNMGWCTPGTSLRTLLYSPTSCLHRGPVPGSRSAAGLVCN